MHMNMAQVGISVFPNSANRVSIRSRHSILSMASGGLID